MSNDEMLGPPREVLDYYDRFPEESRLATGPFKLEFERTKDILTRLLPSPPARVIDVGGAAGAYSTWLTELGYQVHLIDATPRLVAKARERNATLATPIASIAVGDARSLSEPDRSAAVVMIMGPLYHLPSWADRLTALREAHRVLASPGIVVAAGISRFASALDGLSRKVLDPAFLRIRDQDLIDGQHRNPTDTLNYFTTAYFHRPEDLRAELEEAGFLDAEVRGVEGIAWMFTDFESRWADEALRQDILNVARALEAEPSIVGVSAHLLGIGRKL
ncbi:MAG TPA: methyltransferase domain-containing protein [Vicinamibacterales bacterium]|nr:methyltransferase domain-containing protein [Vicinamibacterales bacterium]